MGNHPSISNLTRLFAHLLRDRSGNTLAMIAAALVPLLAMVGGGIDMGRSYLSQTRLQQACDAGVLAARKKLGSQVVATGEVPADVADIGNRFFNLNFGTGSYGTTNRAFQMTMEGDYSISGTASVEVPTTIMGMFGYNKVDVAVECGAKLNFSNTDIMFVLDTTGSMQDTNPGDTEPRIAVMRDVVRNFHTQVEGSKSPGTRVRYGFVPYSTNVNVGTLLKGDWMVDKWNYNGRKSEPTGTSTTYSNYETQYYGHQGTWTNIDSYTSDMCPPSTWTVVYDPPWTDADGWTHQWRVQDGDIFYCTYTSNDGGGWIVSGTSYDNYGYFSKSRPTGTSTTTPNYYWRYQPYELDVSSFKGASGNDPVHTGSVSVMMDGYYASSPSAMDGYFRGCIEERSTYEIDDYDNVDLSRALDLDIDRVPDPANPETQWRPQLNEISWVRSMRWNGTGSFTPASVFTYEDYLNAGWGGFSECPAPSQKLQEMDSATLDGYLNGLNAAGSTYHDIGMIWGARLLSPTGIFADENADVDGKTTGRHLIFLTDGETAPLDLSYSSYGIEPLDQRRWSGSTSETLTEVVESRFAFACQEARRKNITVWVIGFGITLNSVMTDCAGPGRSFEAQDSAQLNDVFSKIAAQMGDLRVTK